MKFISSHTGSAIIHASSDELAPERGINQNDLVNFIGSLYNFTSRPIFSPGATFLPILPFQNGKFVGVNGNTYVIGQLIMIINGDIISAQNTDIALMVAKDLMTQLDTNLGFRYGKSSVKISYLSNIIVDFDNITGNSVLMRLEKLIKSAINRPERQFAIKRLAFGDGEVQPQILPSLESINQADFTIERRAGVPYSANRFFCAAPLSTSEHIELLTKIEEALIG